MAPNQGLNFEALRRLPSEDDKIKVAILGCGMMGQEHISYISGYSALQIDFLCDPFEPSLDKAQGVLEQFNNPNLPTVLRDESDLLSYADDIDLLVIASPNYIHTESLAKWGKYNITILVEKPVAVSQEQHDFLVKLAALPDFIARIWVAMEYRYIPAIAKLLSLIPMIGDLKICSIRENRYPFLHKIGAWNRDPLKTGDTLVEKCCHFFDLFRLITGKEISEPGVRSLAQRGLNYHDEPTHYESPIVDAAFVIFPFSENCTLDESIKKQSQKAVMGCMELCMYAEGSRHQEEIIVTGTKVCTNMLAVANQEPFTHIVFTFFRLQGRLEAYLPENKVFCYQRPDSEVWEDRSEPPPAEAIKETVFDCSDVKSVHDINDEMPTHGGYHYSSTAVEWYNLISAMKKWRETGHWKPDVSLDDGLRAVQMGLCATRSIVEHECIH